MPTLASELGLRGEKIGFSYPKRTLLDDQAKSIAPVRMRGASVVPSILPSQKSINMFPLTLAPKTVSGPSYLMPMMDCFSDTAAFIREGARLAVVL